MKRSSHPTTSGSSAPGHRRSRRRSRRTAAAAKAKVALSDPATQASARAELSHGRLDIALSLGPSSARIEAEQAPSSTVRAVLQTAVDAAHLRAGLAQAGIPLARALPALEPVSITTTVLRGARRKSSALDRSARRRPADVHQPRSLRRSPRPMRPG